jgi:hypothetical protein
MQHLVIWAFAILLVVHGLIHLMGTTVYMKLGQIQGLPYKTTLLGGRWDLGERGIRVFGALWVLPAVGFVLAGAGLFVNHPAWGSLAIVSCVVSLVLTLLDVRAAFAGAILDVLILAAIWMGPILRSQLGG